MNMNLKVSDRVNFIKDETGMVSIFEASIVFPVMFFVLFFIIYIGNAFYQIAQVDAIVMEAAIEGSEWIVNPQQYDMKTKGTIPINIRNTDPYRYILGELPGASIDKIEKQIAEDMEDRISECHSFFIDMNPKVTSIQKDMAEFNNYILFSTFSTEVTYDITFPIRFFGSKEPTVMQMVSCAEVSVNDAPEFIRNVDLAEDLIGEKIKSLFSNINNFLSSLTKKGS